MHIDPRAAAGGAVRGGPRPLGRPAVLAVGASLAAAVLTLAGPFTPAAHASTPDRIVYLSNAGSITEYDATANVDLATIPLSGQVEDLAFGPDDRTLYATEVNPDWNPADPGTLAVIDTVTGKVTASIPVGGDPQGLAVAANGKTVYVANQNDGTVSVVDTVADKVAATVSVGGSPAGIAITPDGSAVWVAGFILGGGISVISTASSTVTGSFGTGGAAPAYIAFSPNGATAYISNFQDDTVSAVNVATRQTTATVPTGMGPYGLALSPDGGTLYAVDQSDGTVTVINTVTDADTATLGIGQHPMAAYGAGPVEAAVSPDGAFVYVTSYADPDTGYAINTLTDAVSPLDDGGSGAWGLALPPTPIVSGVNPNGGPPAGGTQVRITGTGLGSAAAVDFGGVPAGSFTVDGPDLITATAPPGAAGTVDVTVTTYLGTSPLSAADHYSYQVVPTISGITPGYASVSGGSTLTVTGTGFTGPVTVLFGSVPAESVTVLSPTRLGVVAPVWTTGNAVSVDVTVATSAGTSNGYLIRYLGNIKPPPPPSQ